MDSHRIWPFVTGLFHFLKVPPVEHVSEFPSFLRLTNIPVCVEHILFIHSPISKRLGYFPLSALGSAAVDLGVQIPLCDPVFNSLWVSPAMGLGLGAYGNFIFNFWGTTMLFSTLSVPYNISTNSAQGFQFLHIFASTCDFVRVLFF